VVEQPIRNRLVASSTLAVGSIATFKFKIHPILSRKAAKKTVSHFPALNIYLVQILGRVSQLGKRTLAFFAPWRDTTFVMEMWKWKWA
jgi:hypothetical protein